MGQISIILPVLNEGPWIRKTLEKLQDLPGLREIIVVDGGSSDNTVAMASPLANVISSSPGRAKQMNAGARLAKGDYLLFLHADTRVSPVAIEKMSRALEDPAVIGGGFKLSFDDQATIYQLIALGSNLRARFLKIFFGDQGIFVRREPFLAAGGFPDLPIMEEWGLCRKLGRMGKLVLIPQPIITSSRRFKKHGVWKTLLLMHLLKVLYLLGVNPRQLKKLYPNHQ